MTPRVSNASFGVELYKIMRYNKIQSNLILIQSNDTGEFGEGSERDTDGAGGHPRNEGG